MFPAGSGLTRKQRSLMIVIIILLCYIALGGLVNGLLIHLSFIDGLYFTICIIETIGFGDIVPVSTGARIWVGVYAYVLHSSHRNHFLSLPSTSVVWESSTWVLPSPSSEKRSLKHSRSTTRSVYIAFKSVVVKLKRVGIVYAGSTPASKTDCAWAVYPLISITATAEVQREVD